MPEYVKPSIIVTLRPVYERLTGWWGRGCKAKVALVLAGLSLLGLVVLTIYKLPLGHGKHIASIPLGVQATLDADAQTLTIDQPGVRTAS